MGRCFTQVQGEVNSAPIYLTTIFSHPISEFHSFFKLNDILLYVCTTIFNPFVCRWTLALLSPFAIVNNAVINL